MYPRLVFQQVQDFTDLQAILASNAADYRCRFPVIGLVLPSGRTKPIELSGKRGATRNRRLAKDFWASIESAEDWLQLACNKLLM